MMIDILRYILVIIGFVSISYLIISNKLECVLIGIIRTIRRPRFYKGKLTPITGHNFRLQHTGTTYWETPAQERIGDIPDAEVLVCTRCGFVSVAYNYNPDESSGKGKLYEK